MKTFIAAFLLVGGFTLWGTADEPLMMTILICIIKLALIIGGGMLLIDKWEKEI